MNETTTKKIPYGIGNFIQLRENNFYYVDKTRFLPLLEQAGNHLFLIRPRRMGKILLLTSFFWELKFMKPQHKTKEPIWFSSLIFL